MADELKLRARSADGNSISLAWYYGNLAALPTNFHINSLLDVLAIRECNTTGVKCGNSDERIKQSHCCFQCYAFWCEECIGLHNRIKANKDHYALALEDFQDQDFENILKKLKEARILCDTRPREKRNRIFLQYLQSRNLKRLCVNES